MPLLKTGKRKLRFQTEDELMDDTVKDSDESELTGGGRLHIKQEEDWLKDTPKAFDDLKNKQKKSMKLLSSICKSMYILKVYSIHYELKHKIHLSKSACGIFRFQFSLIFIIVYIFVQ